MAAPLFYHQRAGLDTRLVDGEAFVITATTIQHLNGPAAAVWLSLEEPCRRRDVVTLVSELYSDVPRDRITRDVQHILGNLMRLGLVRGSKTAG